MSFIPSVGFIISLLPQVLAALIAIGLKRAVLVAVGSIVINSGVDYVLQPMFKKKGLNLSFPHIKLSLISLLCSAARKTASGKARDDS
jgi:predicted PurR-regulated permease PerM